MDNKKLAGRRWQRLREDADIEQEKASASLGISRVTLSRYENGKQPIPPEVERKMAALYGAAVTRETSVSPERDTHVAEPGPAYHPPQNPLTHPRLNAHGHFRALHEKATAEQRKWLAQLMLDAIVANANDLREILDLEDAPAKSPEQMALEEKLATLPAPTPDGAATHREASAIVMKDAAAKAAAKGSGGARRKPA